MCMRNENNSLLYNKISKLLASNFYCSYGCLKYCGNGKKKSYT